MDSGSVASSVVQVVDGNALELRAAPSCCEGKPLPGMGRAKRYIITIADDNRAPLDKLCEKLIATGATCDVLRNAFGKN